MDERSPGKVDPISSSDPTPSPPPDKLSRPPQYIRFSALLRIGLSTAVILVLMLWLFGAFRKDKIQPGKMTAAAESAVGLTIHEVKTQKIPALSEAVGTVQAEKLTTLASRVVANITEIRVSAGQRVSAGEILVVLDDRDLRHRLEQAQDAVRGAEAALAQAQADYKRDKPLFDQQVISPYDFEHTQTNLKTAEANLHRLEQIQKEAEVNLSYAAIRSPYTGIVLDRIANVGDLAAPGKPLFTMFEQDHLWLEANVPEEQIDRVRLNTILAFRIDAVDKEMQGRVVEIVPSSDPSSRTVAVRVRLNETKDIVPGMFGRLLIPMQPEERTVVPALALIHAGQLTMVDVVEQGQLQRRTIQIGRPIGDQFEVLSGLAPGERIVLHTASSASFSRDHADSKRDIP
jgi:HlyD family secretion protein